MILLFAETSAKLREQGMSGGGGLCYREEFSVRHKNVKTQVVEGVLTQISKFETI